MGKLLPGFRNKRNRRQTQAKYWVEWYGAYDIDPKYLVIWICVESDKVKSDLNSDSDLVNKLREILIKHNYPEKAVPLVHIGFESQETVDKVSNGDWSLHFK